MPAKALRLELPDKRQREKQAGGYAPKFFSKNFTKPIAFSEIVIYLSGLSKHKPEGLYPMALINVFKNLSKKTKIIMAVAAVAVIAVAVTVVLLSRSGYTATTMRLLRVEGTVNIEDSKGGTKPVIDKIRFQSGDALNTGNDGLASVGLDDTKIVTLQSDSRVEFQKQNKKLELKLTKGALFFEVQ